MSVFLKDNGVDTADIYTSEYNYATKISDAILMVVRSKTTWTPWSRVQISLRHGCLFPFYALE